jgi:hypothetical protein
MNALQDRIDTRIPGIALVGSAILAVAAMAHHQTAGRGGDFAAYARNVERIAGVNQAVHGTMIALVAVLTWTLVAFAARRGLHRPLVMAALVAWTIGAIVMLIPPVFNGFVIVDVARRAGVAGKRRHAAGHAADARVGRRRDRDDRIDRYVRGGLPVVG